MPATGGLALLDYRPKHRPSKELTDKNLAKKASFLPASAGTEIISGISAFEKNRNFI
jgi:hypothetical protein